MSKSVIKVSNLSKRYRLGVKEKQPKTLAGQIANVIKSPWKNLKRLNDLNRFNQEDESIFWALKDVSFEVKKGEVLGIIGKNGAGKSTLLKILSQITEPTSGKIEIQGRVASLLEVGTGFHPELSGRENIYMNGTILGMTRREIDSKLDEIIDFSGVEKFIDTPVKFYSSGMKVRLGFSVAAHLDPEILIIDEVLAVGDYEFQRKCLGKMEDVSKNQGRTVLFVSHNLAAVQNLCNNVILLNYGKVQSNGNKDLIIKEYLNANQNKPYVKLNDRKDREGFGNVILTGLEIYGSNTVQSGNNISIYINYKSLKSVKIVEIGMSIWAHNEIKLISLSSEFKNQIVNFPRNGIIRCDINDLSVVAGSYQVNAFIRSNYGIEDYVLNICELNIVESDYYKSGKTVDSNWGLIIVDHNFSIDEISE
ncbi:ABC transporter ATP-binding protein [Algoriphagus marincola]|uniref:ABC transporter ATP-binding protein n=1 Tax=Algoriphagus marincola TaxID=264027 RepID=UPI00040767C1|nr:ABC transporter ATP-binding protein [Algoriphagus marincola]